jgi:hypothetical protein
MLSVALISAKRVPLEVIPVTAEPHLHQTLGVADRPAFDILE